MPAGGIPEFSTRVNSQNPDFESHCVSIDIVSRVTFDVQRTFAEPGTLYLVFLPAGGMCMFPIDYAGSFRRL
eukprot:COSAG02_NODE_716_length_18084_cov_101.241145_10_plen_72_part_00